MTATLAVDDAAWASSWRTRSPADKALLSGGLLAAALVLPPWPAAVLVIVAALGAAVLLAGVPASTAARAIAVPWTFIAIGILPILLTVDTGASFWLTTSPEELRQAASVAGRSFAATSAVMLFALTTALSDWIPRLRRIGVPEPILSIATTTYRLIFGLVDEVRAVRRTQAARLGYSTRRRSLRSASELTANVLLRAWERARRLQDGLAGRGGDGELRVLTLPRVVSWPFRLASLGIVAAIAAVALVIGGAA